MWNDRRVATIFVFLLVFLIFSLGHAIFGKAPEHDDHYFHIKYAYLLRTQGWNVVDHFDWIYLSRGAERMAGDMRSIFFSSCWYRSHIVVIL